MLASDFQRTFASVSPLSVPASLPKAGAKVLPFSHSASTFFNYFHSFLYLTVRQGENSFTRRKTGIFAHLIIYNNASPTGQKSVFNMVYCWLTIVENNGNGPSCGGIYFSNRNEPNLVETFRIRRICSVRDCLSFPNRKEPK